MQKTQSHLCFVTGKESDSAGPRTAFSKTKPRAVAFPRAVTDRFSSADGHELFHESQAPRGETEVSRYAGNPGDRGVTALFRSVGLVKEGKRGGGRIDIHPLVHQRRQARGQPPRNKVLQGPQQKHSPREYNYASVSVGSVFNRTA